MSLECALAGRPESRGATGPAITMPATGSTDGKDGAAVSGQAMQRPQSARQSEHSCCFDSQSSQQASVADAEAQASG